MLKLKRNHNKDDTLFILGASDPEMNGIENILTLLGYNFQYATDVGGSRRVNSRNAYQATIPNLPKLVKLVVWVETQCDHKMVTSEDIEHCYIDHHNVGDYGYNSSPSNYWLGSSIGQVVYFLTSNVSTKTKQAITAKLAPSMWKYKIIAAADHCLGSAYQGLCPGVDPAALRLWRTASRAEFQRISYRDLEVAQDAAIEALLELPYMDGILGEYSVKDARAVEIAELPEAAAISNIAVCYKAKDKLGLLNGSPEQVRIWLDWVYKANNNVNSSYGVPERGYAGAYLTVPVVSNN